MQCAQVVKQANSLLGLIKRIITCRNKEVLLPLYKFLIRPKLEYCIQAWRSYSIKDIKLIEGVQRRATKMMCNSSPAYEDRLDVLELTDLETRCERGDTIHVFNIEWFC